MSLSLLGHQMLNIMYVGSALKPVHKNWQDEIKFTFDVSKCDRIFDALLRDNMIKCSHVIPPLDELKRRAYCKWHNSFSHATNDCNVFRRQVQSAINEGRLSFSEMQVDKQPFPMGSINTIDLEGKKVLLRPEQAKSVEGKDVIIGESRVMNKIRNISEREVTVQKSPNGKESLLVTANSSMSGGQVQSNGGAKFRTFRPKNPEIGKWKVNEAKGPRQTFKPKPTFDQLMNKYTTEKANQKHRDWPRGSKRQRSPPRLPLRPQHE